ncbi:TPA: DUF4113 domain-containing protein, partial [Klebsiella pneumoniae]|nr:DUF4113 domain-containing protein [Klebsiella pneumoniae]
LAVRTETVYRSVITPVFCRAGLQTSWQMKREMLSPRYTTRYTDLLKVR